MVFFLTNKKYFYNNVSKIKTKKAYIMYYDKQDLKVVFFISSTSIVLWTCLMYIANIELLPWGWKLALICTISFLVACFGLVLDKKMQASFRLFFLPSVPKIHKVWMLVWALCIAIPLWIIFYSPNDIMFTIIVTPVSCIGIMLIMSLSSCVIHKRWGIMVTKNTRVYSSVFYYINL